MQILSLSPSQPDLIGAYIGNHVIVLCDTTTAPFTVTLPDAFCSQDVMFEIVNTGSNTLTIQTIKSQQFYVNYNETFTLTLNPIGVLRTTSMKIDGRYIVLYLSGIIGNYPAGNYTAFSADGTMKMYGAATVWQDIDFGVIVKTTGVGAPAYNTLQGNIKMLQWAVNDAQDIESHELFHPVKEGSPLYWHVHFITGGTNVDARGVKFEVEFTGADIGSTLLANNTQSAEYTIPANTPALTHFLLPIYIWSNTFKIGAHIKARLKRIASVTNVAPTANPFCEMVQLHAECDSIGSSLIATK